MPDLREILTQWVWDRARGSLFLIKLQSFETQRPRGNPQYNISALASHITCKDFHYLASPSTPHAERRAVLCSCEINVSELLLGRGFQLRIPPDVKIKDGSTKRGPPREGAPQKGDSRAVDWQWLKAAAICPHILTGPYSQGEVFGLLWPISPLLFPSLLYKLYPKKVTTLPKCPALFLTLQPRNAILSALIGSQEATKTQLSLWVFFLTSSRKERNYPHVFCRPLQPRFWRRPSHCYAADFSTPCRGGASKAHAELTGLTFSEPVCNECNMNE